MFAVRSLARVSDPSAPLWLPGGGGDDAPADDLFAGASAQESAVWDSVWSYMQGTPRADPPTTPPPASTAPRSSSSGESVASLEHDAVHAASAMDRLGSAYLLGHAAAKADAAALRALQRLLLHSTSGQSCVHSLIQPCVHSMHGCVALRGYFCGTTRVGYGV
jgi:hypothetical protein